MNLKNILWGEEADMSNNLIYLTILELQNERLHQ